MRIRAAVSVGLLLATMSVPAASAGPEIYLNGGFSINNLRDDAELFGQAIAASLDDDPGGVWTSDKRGRVGFDLGAGVSFTTSDVLGGAVELRYVTRGAKYRFAEISGSEIAVNGTWKLNYVEIPLLLRVMPPASGRLRPVFEFGPVVAVKASADFEFEANGQSSSFPVGEVIKSTAFAGLVGAGVRAMGSPRSSFTFQARYQLGFTNLLDDETVSFKSSGFSILAGWSWSLRPSE